MHADGSYTGMSQESLESGEAQSGIGGYSLIIEQYKHVLPAKQHAFIPGINSMKDFEEIPSP